MVCTWNLVNERIGDTHLFSKTHFFKLHKDSNTNIQKKFRRLQNSNEIIFSDIVKFFILN